MSPGCRLFESGTVVIDGFRGSLLGQYCQRSERLNQGLELMIDNPALSWGIHIDRVEIKDVTLPDSMKPKRWQSRVARHCLRRNIPMPRAHWST